MYPNAKNAMLAVRGKGLLPELEVMQNRSLTPAAAMLKAIFEQFRAVIKGLQKENDDLNRKLEAQSYYRTAAPFVNEAPLPKMDFSKYQERAKRPRD